jgi:hypothetical protein
MPGHISLDGRRAAVWKFVTIRGFVGAIHSVKGSPPVLKALAHLAAIGIAATVQFATMKGSTGRIVHARARHGLDARWN